MPVGHLLGQGLDPVVTSEDLQVGHEFGQLFVAPGVVPEKNRECPLTGSQLVRRTLSLKLSPKNP